MSRLRSAAPWVLLALGVVVLGIVVAPEEGPDEPFSPTSTGQLGAKALVDVLRELGAQVQLVDGAPDAGVETALLLDAGFDPEPPDELVDWIEAGGTLVVADPASSLAPEVADSVELGVVTASLARRCDLPALADVGRVTAPSGSVYELPTETDSCFPRNEGAWLTVSGLGEGTVVAVGGPITFTNTALGDIDNAVLAVALLAPDPAQARVALLRPAAPPLPGEGEDSLSDLVPDPVRLALWQLLGALVVTALWRARRLGRPVAERPPVEVPGSELVVAVGNLLQTRGARSHAAGLLRADARRVLGERLGLPRGASDEALADAAAARTGARRDDVLAALAASPVADEERLLAVAQSVERVRRAASAPPPQEP